MKHVLGDAMVPIVGACAAVYLIFAWYVGIDMRWAWASTPILLAILLWRQGRVVLGLPAAAYAFAYVSWVGFGPVYGNRGFEAALLPAACLLVQIAGLIFFWLVEHIKHGR